MRKSIQAILFISLLLISFMDCSKSDQPETQTTDEGIPQTPVETKAAPNPYLFKLDGNFEDWADIEPLWDEGGAEGQGAWETNIDIKQVYFKNDAQYLYVFMKCSPTIVERAKIEKSGGIVGDLYFDTDNDPATGGTYILLWDRLLHGKVISRSNGT